MNNTRTILIILNILYLAIFNISVFQFDILEKTYVISLLLNVVICSVFIYYFSPIKPKGLLKFLVYPIIMYDMFLIMCSVLGVILKLIGFGEVSIN